MHLLALVLLLLSTAAQAKSGMSGTAARLSKDALLREDASIEAPKLGRLPSGTILLIQGEEKDGFIPVEVELEDGRVLRGWITAEAFSNEDPDNLEETTAAPLEPKKKRVPTEEKKETQEKKRIQLPKDEILLLRREPSFSYGVEVGPHIGFMAPLDLPVYSGFGITTAALLAIYLKPNVSVQVDGGYSTYSATQSDNTAISLGFMDFSGAVHYFFEPFFLLGGLQYSFGLSLTELPSTVKVDGARDLSHLSLLLGVGYRWQVGDVSFFHTQLQYTYSFQQGPIQLQKVVFLVGVSFSG